MDTTTADATTPGIGVCTDSFQAAGQTGVNPPAICGTNAGYHSKSCLDTARWTKLESGGLVDNLLVGTLNVVFSPPITILSLVLLLKFNTDLSCYCYTYD